MEWEKLNNYIVFDFETSGLSALESDIIYINAIKVIDGKRADDFRVFIKPKDEVPSCVEEYVKITNKMLEDKPSPAEVMPLLKEFIGDMDVIGINNSFFEKFYHYRYQDLLSPYMLSQMHDFSVMASDIFPNIEKIYRNENLALLFNVREYNDTAELLYACFPKLQNIVALMTNSIIEITVKELKQIKKMSNINEIELRDKFHWDIDKANLICKYLSICGYPVNNDN